MTRRRWAGGLLAGVRAWAAGGERAGAAGGDVVVPLHHVLDRRAACRARHVRDFWGRVWPQAVADFEQCGVRFAVTSGEGEVERPAWRTPVVQGLRRGCLNVVVTDRIPVQWDGGRGLAGVTTMYRGHAMCMIAIARAHGHRIPFVATNTCTHEMLHAVLGDVFENRPAGWRGQARESRMDAVATGLWFGWRDGGVRAGAGEFLGRVGGHPPTLSR